MEGNKVALELRHEPSKARAASHLADMLRARYRHDILPPTDTAATIPHKQSDPGHPTTINFPDTIPNSPGPQMQAAAASLPTLSGAAAAAVALHLTLCEGLLLPAPFPYVSLANFMLLTGGVLDLSPPRVPAYTPANLFRLCQMLVPLLALGPPLTALHIPAPCLTSHEPVTPLLPHFSTLTRLCITHGKLSYRDLDQPALLSPGTVAPLLKNLSPTGLRHLAVDAVMDTSAEPVKQLLCAFTAVTSLRLSSAPRCKPHMPSLIHLSLTHVPPGLDDVDIVAHAALATGAPLLRHLHVSGDGASVDRMHDAVLCAWCQILGVQVATGVLSIPPVRTALGMAITAERKLDGSGEVVHCCGFPLCAAAVNLQSELESASISVMSSCVHFFHMRTVSEAFPAVALDAGAPPLQAGRAAAALGSAAASHRGTASGAAALRALSMAVGDRVGSTDHLEVTRRILTGGAKHALGELCVLRKSDLPPRSALCAGTVAAWSPYDRHRPPSWSRRPDEVARGYMYGWVTARSSGVAHPLCALEMLHYNSAPAPATGSGAECNDPAAASGIHTLRVSDTVAALVSLQDMFAAGAPCVSTLQDLSLLCSGGPERDSVSCPSLDLSCLSRLTSLRTLALQGVRGVCSAPARLHLPPALTALLLHGFEDPNSHTTAAEFGQSLLRVQQLQCLDVAVVICRPEGSPCSPQAVDALKAALREGLRPALMMLPLRLGARVAVTGPALHELASPSTASQMPLNASLTQQLVWNLTDLI